MRESGIEGVRLRRRHRTTVPDPAAARAPDLIGRDFTADRPNTKYVGDITYLPVDGGKFCYLATVIDLASRRLVGWAIADHMRADLVTDALASAVRTCGSLAKSIMHTDHGAHYTSRAFAEACRSAGVPRRMSAVGFIVCKRVRGCAALTRALGCARDRYRPFRRRKQTVTDSRTEPRFGGQPVDRRLWTAHYGVVRVNLLNLL
ncbi:Integrase core domain protein [Streptomyces sp. AVP053U2]|nr:Integrase core domain protein [Streptomyces sp. AVP053U2]